MNIPRDILLARHQTVRPKLDAIRREVVATACNHQATKAQSLATGPAAWWPDFFDRIWLELIWPCRRIWTGLAAVWIMLLLVNVAEREPATVASAKHSPALAMRLAYFSQEKLLNELLADHALPGEADQPRNAAPKPRSEITETAVI
jgi:hypothetical protein